MQPSRIWIRLTDQSTVECDFAESIRTTNEVLTYLDSGHRPEERRSFPLVSVLEWKVRDKWDTRSWNG